MSWIFDRRQRRPSRGNVSLRDGLSIGRKDADIALDDRRVSGLHAVIRAAGRNTFELHDNGSKNGVKDSRGRAIDSVTLAPKMTFSIGETTFRVDEPPSGKNQRPAPARATAPRDESPVPKPAAPNASAPKSVRQTWYDVLGQMLSEHADRFRDDPRALTPLEPAVVLEFVRGPQVNSRWILGYGPRRVGPGALDLPLWEPDLPAICFELIPGKDGLVFKTEHRDLVRLNGRAVDSDVLRGGDTIQIKNTLIEVDFTE